MLMRAHSRHRAAAGRSASPRSRIASASFFWAAHQLPLRLAIRVEVRARCHAAFKCDNSNSYIFRCMYFNSLPVRLI